MHQLASELNAVLDGTAAGRLLSDFGKRIYFPKGIIAQAAEAKKAAHNGTIGMAFSQGRLMRLSALKEQMPHLSEEETVAYAPTAGIEKVRHLWKEQVLLKNPSLKPECMGVPIVVPGITAGISYIADLFIDPDQRLISCDPCWDNYALIVEERRKGFLKGVAFLGDTGLDLGAIHTAIKEEAAKGAVRIILNFPNNPAGYSPTNAEAEALCTYLYDAAEGGADVLVICDDAYFGLLYEADACKESLFSKVSCLHPRVLAVKADGPTKEDYVWGLRVAFVTFGAQGLTDAVAAALTSKVMGTIRSSVSCSSTPGQALLVKALASPATAAEKGVFKAILQSRYTAVRRFVEAHAGHRVLKAMPFNSGYFMSFRCTGVDAEALRQTLLKEHGIGTIALGGAYLRLAFSALEEAQIQPVLERIFQTAEALGAQAH